MTTREIPFIYREQAYGIPFVLMDKTSLPSIALVNSTRTLALDIGDKTESRTIPFPAGNVHTPILFPVRIWEEVPATLGSMDPHTLGELDDLSIDFMMYSGIGELIMTNIHGVDGRDIFKYEEPVHFSYLYCDEPFGISFSLGDKFMQDKWIIRSGSLGLALWNTGSGVRPDIVLQKWAEPHNGGLTLSGPHGELLSRLVLRCKPLFEIPHFLGECDVLTLGDLDRFPLGALDRNIALAMGLSTTMASSVSNVSDEPKGASLKLWNRPLDEVYSAVAAEPTPVKSGLSARGARPATLGDLDSYDLAYVDPRPLGMRVFGRVSAVVTTE